MDRGSKQLVCGYFDRKECRSCSQLALSPDARVSRKYDALLMNVRRVLGDKVPVKPLWSPSRIFPSRTKAKLTVSGTLGKPVIGITDRDFRSIELLDCPLHLPEMNRIVHSVKALIAEYRLTPYDIEKRTGELKALILKSNEDASQIMLRFVLRSTESLARLAKAIPSLQTRHPALRVVSANIQPVPAAILEGPEEHVLTRECHIREHFGPHQLVFAPQSFSQVTHETALALYTYVGNLIAGMKVEGMLDLYCGVGGFSVFAAKHVNWIRGVELSAEAVECARLSMQAEQVPNVAQTTFEAADVEAYLETYAGPQPNLIVTNPPRRGLSPRILAALLKMAPRFLVYSSCNPETLLRDLSVLSDSYHVESFAPFDMFPLTEHLEVVAHLTRK